MDVASLEPILQAVFHVLEPLGEEKRATVLAWLQHEAATRPLIQYCCDDTYAWELGKPDPMAHEDDPRTIFGMLEVDGYVVIFAFAEYEADGGTAIQFFRDICFEPKRVCGPMSHDALFDELQAYLTGVDPAAPPHAEPRHNGARA